MRHLFVATLLGFTALAACTSGGTLRIGANSSAGTGADGGGTDGSTCPPYYEPPIVPGFCDGHYDYTYDENGCKVGLHCVDAGASNQCPDIPPGAPNCTAPYAAVVTFDSSTLCPTGSVCGRVLTDADDGATVQFASDVVTALEIRLKAEGAGTWTPDPSVATVLGPSRSGVLNGDGGNYDSLTYNVLGCSSDVQANIAFTFAEPNQAPTKSFRFTYHCTFP
jgi:hypothetical protein